MSEYTVFLSYKSADRTIAEVMERELAPYAPDLKFFLAPTKLVEGEAWRDRLVHELRDSDSLFVIYTSPNRYSDPGSRTNDWLLYEAGLKSTLNTQPDPVICFYPQGQRVPKPLEHLQGVEANRDSLRRFLDWFLRTTDITRRERPLNQNLRDDRLDMMADALATAFRAGDTQYPPGPGVFISYRREESAWAVVGLYERLRDRFGPERVFRDVDSIGLGDDFVEKINEAVGSAAVLLVLIGKQWLTTDDRGRTRLDDPNDYVRVEVEAGLTRDVRVIPILVDGADMPDASRLPDGLKKLARRHVLKLDPERFDSDMHRLVKVLEQTFRD